jgi:hypothetical protein
MKRLSILFLLAVFCSPVAAQPVHSLQLDDAAGHLTRLIGQTTDAFDIFTFPAGGGTLLAQLAATPTVSKAWLLGGNTSSGVNNSIGTLDATDLNLKTNGTTRLSILSGGNVWIGASNKFAVDGSSGNISAINGVTGYSWPLSHSTGQLVNDGSGNLSWGNVSVQTSKAGLGMYAKQNASNFTGIISVAGGNSITKIVPAFAGNITGISAVTGAAIGGGSLIVKIVINGAINPGNNNNNVLTFAPNASFGFLDLTAGGGPTVIPFNPGDQIEVQITSNGIGGGNDMTATVFAQF